MSRFNYQHKGEECIRRKKRVLEGTDISIPSEITNKAVKKDLAIQIREGKYTAGNKNVPQTFRKLISTGAVPEVNEFQVDGRKIPLIEIRKKQYEKKKEFYRLFNKNEVDNFSRGEVVRELDRINELHEEDLELETASLKQKFIKCNSTRNLQFWHDGSCISNHSHLLMVVNTLYDTAIHYTNDEYQQIYNKKIDVQGEIEKPDLYILARCPGDEHQLMYSNTRNKDLRILEYPLNVGEYELNDEARFFHGDGPACELEAGQQKNGNYPCWLCPANLSLNNNLEYLKSLPQLDLKDRTNKILKSVASQDKIKAGKTKLYSKLK